MNEIQKLTQAIRDYADPIDYGIIQTIAKIDREAKKLEAENAALKDRIEVLHKGQDNHQQLIGQLEAENATLRTELDRVVNLSHGDVSAEEYEKVQGALRTLAGELKSHISCINCNACVSRDKNEKCISLIIDYARAHPTKGE
jgi:multidrug resistance efflux pump